MKYEVFCYSYVFFFLFFGFLEGFKKGAIPPPSLDEYLHAGFGWGFTLLVLMIVNWDIYRDSIQI